MKPLNVAVIGAGHLGRLHAQKLMAQPHARLAAVVDPVESSRVRAAADHGVPALADHRGCVGLADAAIVAVPTQLHHAVALDLLRRGVHLLVEKPLAANVREADELVAAAREHGALLQVGHVERINPALAAALPHLSDVKYVQAARSSTFSGRSTDIGVVLDLMIHDIDICLALARSDVVRVEALGVALLGRLEDVAQARLVFANGCVADLSASRVSYAAQRKLHAWCSAGFASVDLAARTATLVRPADAIRNGSFDVELLPIDERLRIKDHLHQDLLPVEQLPVVEQDAISAEQADFIDAIRSLRPPRVSGEQGRDALAVAELILAAIAAHAWTGDAAGPTGPHFAPPSRVIPAPHFDRVPAVAWQRKEAG